MTKNWRELFPRENTYYARKQSVFKQYGSTQTYILRDNNVVEVRCWNIAEVTFNRNEKTPNVADVVGSGQWLKAQNLEGICIH